MAILQVNVRPADRFRRNGRNQRGKRNDEFLTNRTPTNQTTSANASHGTNGNSAISDQNEPKPSIWQNIVWKLMPSTTIGRALHSATERLRAPSPSTASLDAQVILASVLGVDRSWLFAHYDYELNESEAEAYTDLIVRRIVGEPVAYLIGRKEFYGLDLAVDQRVLIPRPETELLVDEVLRFMELYGPRAVRIADIGTGSGAIALALATNSPHAVLYATDLSEEALSVARRNVEQHDSNNQVRLLQGDLLEPLYEQVEIIVANLPYINRHDYATLEPTVRDFEPKLALEAGDDGLEAIRRLLKNAPRYLRPNGMIFLEIAHDQGEAVLRLISELIPQAEDVDLRQDLAGLDRIITVIM